MYEIYEVAKVKCDACGTYLNATALSKKFVRSDALAAGWHEIGDKHLCYDCARGILETYKNTLAGFGHSARAVELISSVPVLIGIIESVLRYYRGENEYNFSGLSEYDRENRRADAWLALEAMMSSTVKVIHDISKEA